ncbi:MAG TPA: exostosin family protein [Cytophagaceae bacterium]|jgi:hypothetical protein
MSCGLVETPSELRPSMPVPYPAYETGDNIEEYFYACFRSQADRPTTERIYLPIFWTAYYTGNDINGKSNGALQLFLDSLDRRKKYFTVLHFYDKGITNNIEGLDILVFSSNYPKGIAIPLLSNIDVAPIAEERTLPVSFDGQPNGMLRHLMMSRLRDVQGFYLSFQPISVENYFKVLGQSNFSLAPAGYGPTSFRLYEAMYFNSIPIYIYDETRWLPYEDLLDWSKLAILVRKERIALLPIILKNYPLARQKEMRLYCKSIWEQYFTLEGVCNYIKQKLQDETKAI